MICLPFVWNVTPRLGVIMWSCWDDGGVTVDGVVVGGDVGVYSSVIGNDVHDSVAVSGVGVGNSSGVVMVLLLVLMALLVLRRLETVMRAHTSLAVLKYQYSMRTHSFSNSTRPDDAYIFTNNSSMKRWKFVIFCHTDPIKVDIQWTDFKQNL